MKPCYILFIVCFFLSFNIIGQRRNYWLSKNLPDLVRAIKYDKIVAYDINPNQKHKDFIYRQVRIDTTIVLSKKELIKSQMDTLEKFIFTSKETSPILTKNCTCPHIAFVYYLEGKMVGYFTSFFEKDNYRLTVTSITETETSEHYFYFVINPYNRKRVNNLCSALGFSNCKEP